MAAETAKKKKEGGFKRLMQKMFPCCCRQPPQPQPENLSAPWEAAQVVIPLLLAQAGDIESNPGPKSAL